MKKFFIIIIFATANSQISNDNLFRLGLSFEQSQEFLKAREIYENLWKNDLRNYNYFDATRRMTISLKEYKKGIEISKSWMKITPTDISSEAMIGGLYYLDQKEKLADSVWSEILKRSKADEFNYRIVANIQVEFRLFEKAIETFKLGRKNLNQKSLFSLELASFYSSLLMFKESTNEYLNYLDEHKQQFDFVLTKLSQLLKSPESFLKVREAIEEENLKVKNSALLLKLKQWIEIENKDFNSAKNTTIELNKFSLTVGEEIFLFGDKLLISNEQNLAKEIFLLLYNLYPNFQKKIFLEFKIAKCYEEIFYKNIYSISSESSFKFYSENGLKINKNYLDSSILFFRKVIDKNKGSELAVKSEIEIIDLKLNIYNDFDEAEKILDELKRRNTLHSEVLNIYLKSAEINIKKNNFQRAEENYNYLQKITKNENLIKLKIAELKFFNGEFEKVIEILNSISSNFILDETNDAMLLQNLTIENYKNNFDALKLFSDARVLSFQNKKINAIENLKKIIEQHISAPIIEDAIMYKAKLEIETLNFESALNSFKIIEKKFPHSKFLEELKFYIAEVNDFFIKNKTLALNNYEEVIAINPNSIYADKSRKRIRILRGENI